MGRTNPNSLRPKPFLRWAGGKTRLVRTLRALVPAAMAEEGTYWEPFLGAGSLFFALAPGRATLSDLNSALIECFRAVRDYPERVAERLEIHALNPSKPKDYYYELRTWYNRSDSEAPAERAAAFIYLNKTCFNGIWRVNTRGEFNVPYGHKDSPALPTRDDLIAASKCLQRAMLKAGDFRDTLKDAREGDLVYLDPPYPPLSTTANFTHYTKERFGEEDHRAVAEAMRELDKQGCKVLVSNADTEFIRGLYKGFLIVELSVTRWIRADGKRYKAKEIAILNYQPPTPM